MADEISKNSRFAGLFLLGTFLFSYPVMTVFNISKCVCRIPLFYLYLFAAWAVLILLIGLCTRAGPPGGG